MTSTAPHARIFESEADLDDLLTQPSAGLIADCGRIDGDVVVLGAGGKMGPSLVGLLRRGLDAAGRSDAKVFAVSRWSDAAARAALEAAGVDTVACDLLAEEDLRGLPDAASVIYMVGAKFGSAANPAPTWAANVLLPGRVTDRYRDSRIAAFSSGNVYPLVDVGSGGCAEDAAPNPVGEYGMSCLGRERIFEYAAQQHGTRVAILRLNYAIDMRYGVLADIGVAVRDSEPLDVTTGSVNVIWQGYANEVAIRSLLHASSDPPFVLNVAGPEVLSVREVARRFAAALGRDEKITGEEARTALLSDGSRCRSLFGQPALDADALIAAQAEWLRRGLPMWGKPTKFGRRDGQF